MDKVLLQKMTEQSNSNVISARLALYSSLEALQMAERTHEDAKFTALTSGAIDGKNEETRKAQLATITAPTREALAKAQAAERKARHELDIALDDRAMTAQLVQIAGL